MLIQPHSTSLAIAYICKKRFINKRKTIQDFIVVGDITQVQAIDLFDHLVSLGYMEQRIKRKNHYIVNHKLIKDIPVFPAPPEPPPPPGIRYVKDGINKSRKYSDILIIAAGGFVLGCCVMSWWL